MREVSVRDTASGERIAIEPDSQVAIYACGPTVYSRIHIGNARPFVVFSLFARFLRSEGYDVRLIVNVTDINDKIYEAATAAGKASSDLAREMTAAYLDDTDRLGLGRPDAEPLASEMIDPIIGLISDLIEGGHAYESEGDVYFSVRSFPAYGELSHRDPEQMDQGEAEGATIKQDPLDFALWKAHKEGEDTSWDSPWGRGRPGWHIECSAMAEQEAERLPLAIHGGGSDLVFPHHENELAQSEAARGIPLARIWMHNGMIETDREKMSKSEGNIFQLSEALDRFGAETVVSYLVSGHYRQPLAFGEDLLEEAAARNERIRNYFRDRADDGLAESDPASDQAMERFRVALADDFNTPAALAELFDLLRLANQGGAPGASDVLKEMLGLLGLEGLAALDEGPDDEAFALLAEREAARADGDFERADRIREALRERGWEVRDSGQGATLVPASGS